MSEHDGYRDSVLFLESLLRSTPTLLIYPDPLDRWAVLQCRLRYLEISLRMHKGAGDVLDL